jgi:anti-sigma regulatory factor (Ser/Thr protein kinase)
MREMALHVLDIAENGINAGASLVEIKIKESKKDNLLTITIRDNGKGMAPEMVERALDPFYTTRTTRRVGLGLSLFREAARRCEGTFEISSRLGVGTEVKATFRRDHIDLAPMGDMAGTLVSLIVGNPGVDFVYEHHSDQGEFRLDTKEVKTELDGGDITHPAVLDFLGRYINEGIKELSLQ